MIVLDYTLREAILGREENLGFQLSKRRRKKGPSIVTDLDFNDDIALLSVEICQSQSLLNELRLQQAK